MIIKHIELENYGINFQVDIENFLNKTIIQDLKILIFGEYNNSNNLTFRKSLITINDIPNEYNIGDSIELKISKKIVIGRGTIIQKNKVKVTEVCINNRDVFSNDINDMFELIPSHDIDYESYDSNGNNIWEYCKGKDRLKRKKYSKDKNESEIKKTYLNGLFKIYYDSIVYSCFVNNINKIEGKLSALTSYISIKNNMDKYLESKNLKISNPNVFIKNVNIEFDALIVNKNVSDEYFFDSSDVKAIIEIKSSGFFCKKDDLIYSKYDSESKDWFIEYITEHEKYKELANIPYVYLSIYESFGQKKSSVHYYEFLLSNLLSLNNNYIGMFCGTKKDSNVYLIPYDYDINELLERIIKS